MNSSPNAIQPSDVEAAARRIEGRTIRTPVLESQRLNDECGARLLFKCENLQRTGAFKFRGATNAVQSLTSEACKRGVATHSSGNHGAALARAARDRGVTAHIVVPEGSVPAKVDAIRRYGGDVTVCEPTLAGREAALVSVVQSTGATVVHPYDDVRVIAGQGTAAHELLEQAEGIEAVVAPVGGGGLISGTTLACALQDRHVDVIGAEPAGADDTVRSLEAGSIVRDVVPDTLADGLRARVGDITFPIIQAYVREVLPVSDEEIVRAMRRLWQRLRVVVEPSSATVLAVVERYADRFAGRTIGGADQRWQRVAGPLTLAGMIRRSNV